MDCSMSSRWGITEGYRRGLVGNSSESLVQKDVLSTHT